MGTQEKSRECHELDPVAKRFAKNLDFHDLNASEHGRERFGAEREKSRILNQPELRIANSRKGSRG